VGVFSEHSVFGLYIWTLYDNFKRSIVY